MDEFETAAKPLCDKIGNSTANVTYYGAWVKTKANTYKDIFMGCCKSCQMLSTIQWLITLKTQIVTLSKFGLRREDALVFRKEETFFIDTYYITAKQNLDKIPACALSTYDLIPVLLGNHVGFAAGFDRLNWESLLLRALAPRRQKHVGYIGRYTSAIANNECLVYVLLTKHYGYECCCYGDRIAYCQERVKNAIKTGANDGVLRGKKTCIIDKDSLGYRSAVNFRTDGIEFRGDVHNLMNHMERTVIN
ncbi:hypothetical protein LOAG_18138 [Loa loa]|uniref:Uncharacterized protein n=1 Tax=Loa loa TaxID=7209 RepID=A0A1S0UI38_LOALO|nr:hypothetical protein LOAG_18138 [Loa loa]EJD74557.1 hypothetical protein LOAG_18138 [Loa loa]